MTTASPTTSWAMMLRNGKEDVERRMAKASVAWRWCQQEKLDRVSSVDDQPAWRTETVLGWTLVVVGRAEDEDGDPCRG